MATSVGGRLSFFQIYVPPKGLKGHCPNNWQLTDIEQNKFRYTPTNDFTIKLVTGGLELIWFQSIQKLFSTAYFICLKTAIIAYLYLCGIFGIICHWSSYYSSNYANPVYGVATIRHQVRCLRWGHPSLFHTATSLLMWYKMLCVRDISYKLIWMKFMNTLSVYTQSGTDRRFNWRIIAVLT